MENNKNYLQKASGSIKQSFDEGLLKLKDPEIAENKGSYFIL